MRYASVLLVFVAVLLSAKHHNTILLLDAQGIRVLPIVFHQRWQHTGFQGNLYNAAQVILIQSQGYGRMVPEKGKYHVQFDKVLAVALADCDGNLIYNENVESIVMIVNLLWGLVLNVIRVWLHGNASLLDLHVA